MPGRDKHIDQHRFRQLTRRSVLLAWMVGGEQVWQSVTHLVNVTVRECVTRFSRYATGCAQQLQVVVERNPSQRDDDTDAREKLQLRFEKWTAGRDFERSRLVVRRSAMRRSADIRVPELQAVIGSASVGLG